MIKRIHLKNITVFERLDLSFSPGINAMIGPNGSGKTHVLKMLYAYLLPLTTRRLNPIRDIVKVFLPSAENCTRLRRRSSSVCPANARVEVITDGPADRSRFAFSIEPDASIHLEEFHLLGTEPPVTYIPPKEMLANAPGFLSLYDKYDLHFESVYADILKAAFLPPLRHLESPGLLEVMAKLQERLRGEVVQKGEHFFLGTRDGEIEFTMLGEGLRKLGLLWLLVRNGSLCRGATLLWDEPETNLNPSLLRVVAEVLLLLQREGIQIFLATHNQILLRMLDLLRQEGDRLRFISFDLDEENNRVTTRSGEDYLAVVPNPISDSYVDIFDMEVQRSLGDFG